MIGPVVRHFAGHGVAANILMLLILGCGVLASSQIRQHHFADRVMERLFVSIFWPGAGPEDVDQAIVARIEPALRAIEGVAATELLALPGEARVSLEFADGWDMSRAAAETKAALDAIVALPEGAEVQGITRGAFRELVVELAIHGPVPRALLSGYARALQERFFEAGLTQSTIRGAVQANIRVEAREVDLVRHDVTIAEIAQAIAAAADSRPAGTLGDAGSRVRVGEVRRSVEEIAAIALPGDGAGRRITVRDIAAVAEDQEQGARTLYFKGHDAVVLSVHRGAGADALDIHRHAMSVVGVFAAALPAGVHVTPISAPAQEIEDRIALLLENAAAGFGLVIVILILFLSPGAALWVAMGIPVTLAGAIALMWLLGLTVNMLSLFALIVCLGIIVDDAIVVGEHVEELGRAGASPALAAAEGSVRMAGPVLAGTTTTIIAFCGLLSISGGFGAFLSDIPVVVAAILAASAVECFLILPAHMRAALAGAARIGGRRGAFLALDRGLETVRDRIYRPALRAALAARWLVASLSIAFALHGAALLLDGHVIWRFWSPPELRTVDASLVMKFGSTRSDTVAQLEELDAALRRAERRIAGEDGVVVEHALLQVGAPFRGGGAIGAEDVNADRLAGISVTLVPPDRRSLSQNAFILAWEEEIRRLPALEALSLRGGRGGPGEAPIAIRLTGRDPAGLRLAADALKQRLTATPAIGGVEDDLAPSRPELSLSISPIGEALGVTPEIIGRTLRDRLSGAEASEFLLDGRPVTVTVALDRSELGFDYLSRATIRAPSGAWIRLSEVVEPTERSGFSLIRRKNGQVTVSISADFVDDDPERVAGALRVLREDVLPELEARFGVTAMWGGLVEQERSFLSDTAAGVAMACIGVYVVLVWLFGSWSRPLIVLATVPAAAAAAVWGHFWLAMPFSVFSVVGLIGMSGVIVNGSIVVVARTEELRLRAPIRRAIVDAACDRFRAVLLTTMTTVVGLAPLLVEESREAIFLKPAVVTLVLGLAFGSLLVLFATPALLAIHHDVAASVRSTRRTSALLRRSRGPRRRRKAGMGSARDRVPTARHPLDNDLAVAPDDADQGIAPRS